MIYLGGVKINLDLGLFIRYDRSFFESRGIKHL